ncbi:MAG: alpha/beta hydrolase [Acidimicrobiales bacterium]|nr:alpha/beta hydrolase [Hyphomonadaceae bacterium]RZV40844.1 MAG: alpha/beta hydrolase [Acidimicrobiales bacterium]
MTEPCTPLFLSSPAFAGVDNNQIAYKTNTGRGEKKSPGLIWCGGLKSDMEGSKATALHDWAADEGRAYVRFDYFGHGASTGRFRDGTVSRWAADTIQVIDELTEGPQILIGSSMGGWTSLLAALARPDRIRGLLLIAPAPDFSEKLMWAGFDETIRKTIMDEGIYYQPSDYDEPYEISREMILDGRNNQILDAPIKFVGPVRILQGMNDTSVPPAHAQKVFEMTTSDDIEMTLVKNGDHSLSEPYDLDRLIRTAKELCRLV